MKLSKSLVQLSPLVLFALGSVVTVLSGCGSTPPPAPTAVEEPKTEDYDKGEASYSKQK